MIALFTGLVTSLTVIGWLYIVQLPYPQSVTDFAYPKKLTILDKNNQLLYAHYAETVKKLEQPIPNLLAQSVIATQDHYFYTQSGIDWPYLAKASNALLFQKALPVPNKIIHTLARQSYKKEPTTFYDLIKETILVLRLEHSYSKDSLLKLFLATRVIGRTIGIENASAFYFDKQLSQLTPAEMIYLATLSSTSNDLIKSLDPESITTQYAKHVDMLHEKNILTQTQVIEFATAPKTEASNNRLSAANATKLVLKEMVTEQSALDSEVIVQSSIDMVFQNAIQRIIIENFHSENQVIPPIAVLIVNAETGEVLVFSGSQLQDAAFNNLLVTAQHYLTKT